MRTALSLLSLFTLVVACGPPPPPELPPPVFSDEPLAGVVGAVPWTFVAGETSAFLSDEEGFFTVLGNVAVTACEGATVAPELLTSLPREVGVERLGFGKGSVTFSAEAGENLVGIVGATRIDEITDTTITGALKASFDDDNKVDGVFTVTICP